MVSSYRQTIQAYPQGGGAYIVTKDNLGTLPALVAASALLIDYVLTVAVSVAAGVAAITSAFPVLLRLPRRARRALHRADRDRATCAACASRAAIFAVPTYLFVVSFAGMLAYGIVRWLFGWERVPPPRRDPPAR